MCELHKIPSQTLTANQDNPSNGNAPRCLVLVSELAQQWLLCPVATWAIVVAMGK